MSRRQTGEREAYWQGVIEKQRTGGLSIAAFCREEGISPASFFAWRRRLVKPSPARKTVRQATPQFVPVAIPAASADFEVRLPNGVAVLVPGGFAEAPLGRLLQLVAALDHADA